METEGTNEMIFDIWARDYSISDLKETWHYQGCEKAKDSETAKRMRPLRGVEIIAVPMNLKEANAHNRRVEQSRERTKKKKGSKK